MRLVRPSLVQDGAPAIHPASPVASPPASPHGVSFAAALLQSGLAGLAGGAGAATGALLRPLTLSQAHEFLQVLGPHEAIHPLSMTVAEHDLGEDHVTGYAAARRIAR